MPRYFDDDLCDEDELAHFAESSELVSFLLERIQNPRNLMSQYNAVNVLRHLSKLFGRESEIKAVLLGCCEKYPETPKTVCRLAIFSLRQLRLHTAETTKTLFALFGESQEDYLRLGMYEYLVETGEHNEYVQFFLSGIQYIVWKVNDPSPRVSNELFELARGLKSMDTAESVKQVLRHFSEEKHLEFHDSGEVLSTVIDTAIRLYQNGQKELFDAILADYLNAAQEVNHIFELQAVRFFSETGTLYDAALSAAEHFAEEPQHIGTLVYTDASILDFLATAYEEGKLKSVVFQSVVGWYVREEGPYNRYADLMRRIDGIELPKFQPRIDYEALRKCADQEYFCVLLDTGKRLDLFSELVCALPDPNILTTQLLDVNIRIAHHTALKNLQVQIYHYGANVKVSEFFERVDPERFMVRSASEFLKRPHIVPNEKQKSILVETVRKLVEGGIFENAVEYSSTGVTIKALAPEALSIIQYFDMPMEEETLLNLTELPACVFKRKIEGEKYQYLKDRLDREKLRLRLKENVEVARVENMVLQDHIRYFDSIRDAGVTPKALEICKEEKDNTILRSIAWKYLVNTMGVDYLCERVIPFADGDFLMELAGSCKEIPRKVMLEAMERWYMNDKSLYLQAHLISLGSVTALSDYVEFVRTKKVTPEGDSIVHDGPTAAIRSVQGEYALPFLGKLLDVIFDAEFVDCSWRGLRSTLRAALINCGKNAPKETIEIIEKHRSKELIQKENVRFCNYTINEIRRAQVVNQDLPMTLQETMKVLQNSAKR